MVDGCGFQSVKQSDAPLPRKRPHDSMVWHVEPPLKGFIRRIFFGRLRLPYPLWYRLSSALVFYVNELSRYIIFFRLP